MNHLLPYDWADDQTSEPTPFLAYPVLRPWWLRWLGRYRVVKIWSAQKYFGEIENKY